MELAEHPYVVVAAVVAGMEADHSHLARSNAHLMASEVIGHTSDDRQARLDRRHTRLHPDSGTEERRQSR